ncbi:hypothetical protein SDC9_96026 [bioreactor metagenome]|uniref:Uncharacterized protein n=1 Tax=bioreactor metagenome TaxID=1076179 RepID=A0A645A896_9ZZZZ
MGGEQHRHVGVKQLLNALQQIAAQAVQAAKTESLNHHPPVAKPRDVVKHLRPCAGDELEQKNIRFYSVIQHGRKRHSLRRRNQAYMIAADNTNRRPVDAFKRILARRPYLANAAAEHNLTVKHHKYSRNAACRGDQRVLQIQFRVGIGMTNGQLRARNHHRLIHMPQHEGEHGCGVRHGVRPMQHHNAVMLRQAAKHLVCNHTPFFRLNIGTIQIKDGLRLNLSEFLRARRIGQNIIRGQCRNQPVRRLRAGDGSAGGEDHQLFHICSRFEIRMSNARGKFVKTIIFIVGNTIKLSQFLRGEKGTGTI